MAAKPISDCKTATKSSIALVVPSRQRGFTLLEILLVLSIIAMASIFVVPNIGGFEARTFNTQVRQANSLLNYARRTAVVSGQASSVSFNVLSIEERDLVEREDETFYPEGGSTGGVLLFAQADQLGVIDVDPFTGRITTQDPEEEFR